PQEGQPPPGLGQAQTWSLHRRGPVRPGLRPDVHHRRRGQHPRPTNPRVASGWAPSAYLTPAAVSAARHANNLYGRLQQAALAAARSRTPAQRVANLRHVVSLRNQLLAALVNYRNALGVNWYRVGMVAPPGYRMQSMKTEVEFQAAESVKVRTLVLP